MTRPTPPRDTDLLVDDVLDEADRILAGPLPRLGEVIRDTERCLAQALLVLGRAVDPASEPDVLAWPQISDLIRLHDLLIKGATSHIAEALSLLSRVADLPLPPVGSAIKFPARQDPEAVTPVLRIATTDGPDQTPRREAGKEPAPGSAAATATAACESDGGLTLPVAGASSGPSPRHTGPEPDGAGAVRGAGPGYLGAEGRGT